MMPIPINSPFLVYTLHFAEPVQGKQHYTGITKSGRFLARMSEHGRGFGSSLTHRVSKLGITMWCVDVQPALGPEDERRIKRAGHARLRCKLCKQGLSRPPSETTIYELPRRPTVGNFRATEW